MGDIELRYQDLTLTAEQWADRCQYLIGLYRLANGAPSAELLRYAQDLPSQKNFRNELDLAFAAYLDSFSKKHPLRKWEGVRFADLNKRLDLIESKLTELKEANLIEK